MKFVDMPVHIPRGREMSFICQQVKALKNTKLAKMMFQTNLRDMKIIKR